MPIPSAAWFLEDSERLDRLVESPRSMEEVEARNTTHREMEGPIQQLIAEVTHFLQVPSGTPRWSHGDYTEFLARRDITWVDSTDFASVRNLAENFALVEWHNYGLLALADARSLATSLLLREVEGGPPRDNRDAPPPPMVPWGPQSPILSTVDSLAHATLFEPANDPYEAEFLASETSFEPTDDEALLLHNAGTLFGAVNIPEDGDDVIPMSPPLPAQPPAWATIDSASPHTAYADFNGADWYLPNSALPIPMSMISNHTTVRGVDSRGRVIRSPSPVNTREMIMQNSSIGTLDGPISPLTLQRLPVSEIRRGGHNLRRERPALSPGAMRVYNGFLIDNESESEDDRSGRSGLPGRTLGSRIHRRR